MFRIITILAFSLFSVTCFAQDLSAEQKKEYATKIHQAFLLQSVGKTTKAYYCFKSGYQQALRSGESVKKLQLIEDLFHWYRKYGYSLGITTQSSNCIDEFRSHSSHSFGKPFLSRDYQSEWGNTPEQAEKIREFILGVGETISGIFCIYIGTLPIKAAGTTLFVDGLSRMWTSLNSGWTDYERSLLELKNWEKTARQTIQTE